MKYAIIADIHGNLEAFEAVLQDIKLQGVEKIACLGDIVGYGPNPKECLEMIHRLNIPCVKGNHDEYCSSEFSPRGFNPPTENIMQWTRDQLDEDDRQWLRDLPFSRTIEDFTMVHATLDEPHRWGYAFDRLMAAASFPYQNTPVCFYGHTHIPVAFARDAIGVRGGTYVKFDLDSAKKYFINPGAVGQPRDNNPQAAYVIYDLAARTIELRRLDYDIAKTQQKIRDLGF